VLLSSVTCSQASVILGQEAMMSTAVIIPVLNPIDSKLHWMCTIHAIQHTYHSFSTLPSRPRPC